MNYVWILMLGMFLGGTPAFFLGVLLAGRPTHNNVTISVKRN
jgi:hypothetical protein